MHRLRLIIKTQYPAIVKIDGKFVGECGLKPMVLSAISKENYFIEVVHLACANISFVPIAINFLPYLSSYDCSMAEITKYSKDTYRLDFTSKRYVDTGVFQPLEQVMFVQENIQHYATLYYDGVYCLEMESSESIFKKPIDYQISNALLTVEKLNNQPFIILQGDIFSQKYILLMTFDGDDYCILSEHFCTNYKIEEQHLVITKQQEDMFRHTDEVFYSFDGKELAEVKRNRSSNFNDIKLPDKLLPYALVECIKAENEQNALALLDKATYKDTQLVQLINYFGEFTDALQNYFDKQYASYLALRYKISGSLYELKYYKFITKDGLIENIIAL